MELFVWVVTVLSVKSRDISYSICQGPPPSPCGLAFGHHLGLARLGILWPMQLQILGQKQRTTYPVDHGPTRRRLPSFRTGLACSRPVLPSVLPFANSLSNGCASFPPSRVFFLGKKTHEALVFPFAPIRIRSSFFAFPADSRPSGAEASSGSATAPYRRRGLQEVRRRERRRAASLSWAEASVTAMAPRPSQIAASPVARPAPRLDSSSR